MISFKTSSKNWGLCKRSLQRQEKTMEDPARQEMWRDLWRRSVASQCTVSPPPAGRKWQTKYNSNQSVWRVQRRKKYPQKQRPVKSQSRVREKDNYTHVLASAEVASLSKLFVRWKMRRLRKIGLWYCTHSNYVCVLMCKLCALLAPLSERCSSGEVVQWSVHPIQSDI